MRSDHPLFIKYPLDSTVQLGGEDRTSPYHIYDGDLVLIGGRTDAAAAADLLAGERLTPVLDSEGSALMALWLGDFTAANLGPHHELQISLFGVLRPQPRVKRDPFAIHRLLILNPDVYMICHGLWNNTPKAVGYNQAHLGLDAHLSASRIDHDREAQRMTFQVSDAASGKPVAEGSVGLPARQALAVTWSMAQHLGFKGMMEAARTPFIHVPVVNTRSAYAADNCVAHTYTRSDRQIIRRYGNRDSISIQHPRYAPPELPPRFRPAQRRDALCLPASPQLI